MPAIESLVFFERAWAGCQENPTLTKRIVGIWQQLRREEREPYSCFANVVLSKNEQSPKKFEFIVNLKTAKQIGLTIPQSVLYRADKVIK